LLNAQFYAVSIRFTEPWHAIEEAHGRKFVEELRRELSPGHSLFGQPIVAVARRFDRDDVLFRVGHSPEHYAVVHLTFQREDSLKWPNTKIFESLDQFMAQDSK
jgi:hypothetical protein